MNVRIKKKKKSDFRTCHAKEHILLCENGFILAPSKKNFCQPKNKKKFFISEVLPKGVASIQLSKIQKLQLEQYFQENPN